jgi:hypothetical protein
LTETGQKKGQINAKISQERGIDWKTASTRPGIDAIGLTRWVWNGRQRSLMNHGEDKAPLKAESSAIVAPQNSSDAPWSWRTQNIRTLNDALSYTSKHSTRLRNGKHR